MDPAANIDFNEKGITVVEFKSLDQLRDYFLDGTDIKIIEKKVGVYQIDSFRALELIISLEDLLQTQRLRATVGHKG